MIARYPGDVVVAGIYGSAASGADTPWSDLDLLFVTRAGSTFRTTHIIYHGTAVELHVIEQSTLEELLVAPSPEWPYWMGVLGVAQMGDTGKARSAPMIVPFFGEHVGRLHMVYIGGAANRVK